MRFAALSIIFCIRLAAAPASIDIDASHAGNKIPRTIYGTFLEPIGKSIYGGLWAQVLENPSFEANLWSAENLRREIEREPALAQASAIGLPVPWEPLDPAQGWRYEPRWGDAANGSRSLMIMALPGKPTGVRQAVYLPVHRVLRYTGSVWVKHLDGPRETEVSLRRRHRADAVLARQAIALSGDGWKRYEFALELERGALARLEPADFVFACSHETRVLLDQAFLFPADHVHGMDPDMIAISRALESPLVRYGGNFTSGYHWRDGIGPMDQRVSMLNQAWGMPEYNHFGTDEFLEFCKLVKAEPQIALNLGSGTPEEAGAWVRYVNERWGHGGLLWELGNELYGTWQIGYPTIERAAARMNSFVDAVLRADPQARLIATGSDPDQKPDWNASLLRSDPIRFHFLSTHFVVGVGGVRKSDAMPDFVAESGLALPVGLERRLREMKKQIDAEPRAREVVKLAFTEWLFHGPDDRVPRFTNMGGALCAAGFLNTLMRVADFTPVADMTGLIEFGGIWKKRSQVYGVPAYWAFRMYSTAGATRAVEARTAVETYDVADGNRRIPEIRGVPYLDVVAALNDAGDKLTLYAVNRHLNRDIETDIRIAGFAPRTARVRTLKGTSIHQANDETRPEAVYPSEDRIPAAREFRYTFPRSSVTVMELLTVEHASACNGGTPAAAATEVAVAR